MHRLHDAMQHVHVEMHMHARPCADAGPVCRKYLAMRVVSLSFSFFFFSTFLMTLSVEFLFSTVAILSTCKLNLCAAGLSSAYCFLGPRSTRQTAWQGSTQWRFMQLDDSWVAFNTALIDSFSKRAVYTGGTILEEFKQVVDEADVRKSETVCFACS